MAASRHNLTRRALLGVGLVLPALAHAKRSRAAALQPGWARALRAFRRAEARLAAAFRAAFERLPPPQRAFPACVARDDRFDALESARLAALRRLLQAPAPDLPALSLKIGLTIDEAAWELTGAPPCSRPSNPTPAASRMAVDYVCETCGGNAVLRHSRAEWNTCG